MTEISVGFLEEVKEVLKEDAFSTVQMSPLTMSDVLPLLRKEAGWFSCTDPALIKEGLIGIYHGLRVEVSTCLASGEIRGVI